MNLHPQLSQPQPEHDERRKALFTLLSAAFISLLAVSILNVSIPAFSQSLAMSPAGVQWTMSGYALAFGLMLVPAGRLGDAFGRRRLFVIGNALFFIAALGGGLALNAHMLIGMRLVEGIAAATISPQVMGLIQQLFQGAERARAFGLFGMVVGVATAIGPTLGGVLIGVLGINIGWRAAFLINLPICLAAIYFGYRYLPVDGKRGVSSVPTGAGGKGTSSLGVRAEDEAGVKPKLHLDLPGIALLGISVLALMMPFMSGATSWQKLAAAPWYLLVVAGIGLVLFFWFESFSEKRGKEVVLPKKLQRDPSYVVGTLLLSVFFAGWSGLFVIYTLYLQEGLGLVPWMAGALQLPLAVASGIFAPLSSRLLVKWGRWLLVVSVAITVVGLLGAIVVVHLAPRTLTPWLLVGVMFLAGAGSGLFVSPAQSLSLVTVPVKTGATAAGASQTAQRVGTAIGIAISTLMFYTFLGSTSGLQPGSERALAAYTGAFQAGFGAVVVMIALAGIVAVADACKRPENPLREQ